MFKNKQIVKDILTLVFLWYIVFFVTTLIFKGMSDILGIFGTLLMTFINIGSFIFIVGLPVWKCIQDSKPGNTPAERACKEILEEEARIEELRRNLVQTTPEVAAIRQKRTQDIHACLDGTGMLWQWATAGTVNRLYLYTPEMMQKGLPYYSATFEPNQEGRIIAISAKIDDKPVTFVNEVYRQYKEMENQKRNQPVQDFMAAVMPSATWHWEDIKKHLIMLTDITAGYKDVIAQVAYAQNGAVSFLSLHDAAGTIIKCTDKVGTPVSTAASSKAAPSPAAAQEEKGETVKLDTSASEIDVVPEEKKEEEQVVVETVAGGEGLNPSAGNQAQPAQEPSTSDDEEKKEPASAPVVAPKQKKDRKVEIIDDPDSELSDEERKGLEQYVANGGLRPTDEPGLSDEDMMRASKNTYEFLAADINSYAVSAMENGEDNFTIRWPDGIQTTKEAYFFAKYIVEQVDGFEHAKVRHSNMTITIFLAHEEY